MLINREKELLESVGIENKHGLFIGDIDKVMFMLINMYKDPIMAFIREILSNARDAHREAGIPERPIKVDLPSHFRPSIKITDYGPGISPERMNKIYRGLGLSTKDKDNLQTGGFGLGSKTPWSYTDTFIIVTHHKTDESWQKTHYVACRADEIAMQEMHSTPVDEEQKEFSTCIEIPVKASDFNKVNNSFYYTVQFWDVLPDLYQNDILKNYPVGFKHNDFQVLSKDKRWGIYKSEMVNGLIAIVDGIIYKIDRDSCQFLKNASYESAYNKLLISNVALFFNNGELSLIPSREDLSYDKSTQAKLEERINLFFDEYFSLFNEQIQSYDLYRDALVFASETLKYVSYLESKIRNDANWHGHPLKWNLSSDDFGKFSRIMRYSNSSWRKRRKLKDNLYITSSNFQIPLPKIDFSDTLFSRENKIDTDKVSAYMSENNLFDLNVIHLPPCPDTEFFKEFIVKNELSDNYKATYEAKWLDFFEISSLDDFAPVKEFKEKSKRILSSKSRDKIVARSLTHDFAGNRFTKTAKLINNFNVDHGTPLYYLEYDPIKNKFKLGDRWYTYLPKTLRPLCPPGLYAVTKQVIKYLSNDWRPAQEVFEQNALAKINSTKYTLDEYIEADILSECGILDNEIFLNSLIQKNGQNKIYDLICDLYSNILKFQDIASKIRSDLTIDNIIKSAYAGYININIPATLPSKTEFMFYSLKHKFPLLFWALEKGKINLSSPSEEEISLFKDYINNQKCV